MKKARVCKMKELAFFTGVFVCSSNAFRFRWFCVKTNKIGDGILTFNNKTYCFFQKTKSDKVRNKKINIEAILSTKIIFVTYVLVMIFIDNSCIFKSHSSHQNIHVEFFHANIFLDYEY